MNCYFTFSDNNYCWFAITDQTYSNAHAEQWPNFQLWPYPIALGALLTALFFTIHALKLHILVSLKRIDTAKKIL